jgi:hypothetical protein
VALNDGEKIPKIVRDPGGKPADGYQPLRILHLWLKLAVLPHTPVIKLFRNRLGTRSSRVKQAEACTANALFELYRAGLAKARQGFGSRFASKMGYFSSFAVRVSSMAALMRFSNSSMAGTLRREGGSVAIAPRAF